MAHAQKPYLVFRRKGRVQLNRRGASVQSTTGSRGVRISGGNAGYVMFRGSVKSTVYPLHSPVSPSLLLPCVALCHHISIGLLSTVEDEAQSQVTANGRHFIFCPKPDLVFWRNGRVHLNRPGGWGGASSVDYWQPRCAYQR